MKLVDRPRLFNNSILILLHLFFNCSVATAQQTLSFKKNDDRLCGQPIEKLATLLSEDITDYGNRVIQKSQIYSHSLNFLPTYIVTFSLPETEPLALPQFPPDDRDFSAEVKQIFLTSLERQYLNDRTVIETENYHWLLMTKITNQWHLVMAFTRFGYPEDDDFLVSPIRDTTEGTIGQAVKLWLKDCRAGTLKNLRTKD